MNVYEILSESVTEQDKDTHCSDKCCGAEVKREDCKCSADCKHCNCNDPKVNEGPNYDASDIHRGDAITCKPCKGKGCEHCDYKGVHPKEVDEASSLDSYYQLTKAKRLAKADGHDYDKLPEYHRGKDHPHKEKYKALAAEGVDEAGIVSKIKDKLGFGKKKAVNKPKLKRNPRIKVAKGAGQVSRASDGNVYVWAGAAWVNNETAKFAPKQVTAELGNPVLIGLANQIKKAGLTDVVKPFLLSV